MTARVDGPNKVTGRARYAFEHPVDGAAYVWAVPSVIAKGSIRSIDASAALALPGVLAVITPDNAPRLSDTGDPELALFQSRAVAYRGQFVAAAVADTLEVAREAADQVRIDVRAGGARRDADLRPPRTVQAGSRQPALRDRYCGGRLRRRVRRGRGPRRRDLPDSRRAQQSDGTARHDRGVARGHADLVRLDPGPVPGGRPDRRRVRARTGPACG